MEYLIALILGAIFCCYRGGIFKNRTMIVNRISWKPLRVAVNWLVQGDTVHALAFAFFCIVLHRAEYQGIVDGMPVYVFLTGAAALFVVQFVMTFRGATPGWGEFIGAAGGWRPDAAEPELKHEVAYIDKIIEPLKDRPRLWGIAGLSIRCAEWGLFIGVPLVGFIGFQAFLPALAGLLAGPVVYGLSKILPQKYVWKAFEGVLGALLWVSCV